MTDPEQVLLAIQCRVAALRDGRFWRLAVRVPLARDKTAAQAKLNALIRKAERADAGLPDYDECLKQPIGRHLDDYCRHLASKDDTAQHVQQTMSRIQAVAAGCGFRTLAELDEGDAADWLASRRHGDADESTPTGTAVRYADIAQAFGVSVAAVNSWKRAGAPIRPNEETDLAELAGWRRGRERSQGMSPATSNHYVGALRSFGRWLVRTRRMDHNPFANLDRIDTEIDIRRDRRALPIDEFGRLIDATRADSQAWRGLTGEDRAMLYVTAAYTGLRANELATLTPRTVALAGDPPALTVKAAYSKRRREDVQPLRQDLAGELQNWLANRTRPVLDLKARPDDEPLWPGNWSDDAAEMLRGDLARAGIAYRDDDGRVFDFHALRHQFISNLAAAGVHPKTAQQLARHSSIQLTMDRYTHLAVRDAAGDLDKLPALPTAGDRQEARATGTDGRPADFVCAMFAHPVSKRGQTVASSGTEAETAADSKRGENPKENKGFQGKGKVRLQGLEPWTYGLKVRCSTD